MKVYWVYIVLLFFITFDAVANHQGCIPVGNNKKELNRIGRPFVEIPMTFLPLSRSDMFVPMGTDKTQLPYVGIGGGNYVMYPNLNWPVGLLAGFSYGQYTRRFLSGHYDYQGIRQPLNAQIHSRLRNYRLGLKAIDYSSFRSKQPFAEMYIARSTMFTALSIDEIEIDESTPMIESKVVLMDHTLTAHLNFGLQFNLFKNEINPSTMPVGEGAAFHFAVGYVHGLKPIKHLDISQIAGREEFIPSSGHSIYRITSDTTNLEAYAPMFESRLRFLNFSFGLILTL